MKSSFRVARATVTILVIALFAALLLYIQPGQARAADSPVAFSGSLTFDCDAGTAEVDGILSGGEAPGQTFVSVMLNETFPVANFTYDLPANGQLTAHIEIPGDRPSEISIVADDVTVFGPADTDCASDSPNPGSYFGLAYCTEGGGAAARVGYIATGADSGVQDVKVTWGVDGSGVFAEANGPLDSDNAYWATIDIAEEGTTAAFVNVLGPQPFYAYFGDRSYTFPSECYGDLLPFDTAPVPAISGTAKVGSTLTANTGAWSPSASTFTYQWKRDGIAITDATSPTYTLQASDGGTNITVTVTGSADGRVATSRTSTALAVPRLFKTAPAPTISGTLKVGAKLTASAGTWSPTPTTLTYQWRRNGTAISGATARTYVLVKADGGALISVSVTGKRSGYTTTSRTSTGKRIPGLAFTTAPTPRVSGTAKVGNTLTASAGTWSPSPTTVRYQWLRSGAPITGATEKTYRLQTADAGANISVKVTAARAGYNVTSRTSAAKAIPRLFSAAPVPTITGPLTVGSTLTADPGAWSPTPTTLSYQWLRNGTAITGATAKTYKLVVADAGTNIAVRVTGAKSGYTTTRRISSPSAIPIP